MKDWLKNNWLNIGVLAAILLFAVAIFNRSFYLPSSPGLYTTPGADSSETISIALSILEVLLVVMGIVSLGAFIWLKQHFESMNKSAFQDARNLSGAETKLSIGLFHMALYETFREDKTKSQDAAGEALTSIENAISETEKAKECLDNIKDKKIDRYFPIQAMIFNNLIYFLSRKWNYYKDNASDSDFKKYLELQENFKLAQEYRADKNDAAALIRYLEKRYIKFARRRFPQNFLDTKGWFDKVFSVEPDIPQKMRSGI